MSDIASTAESKMKKDLKNMNENEMKFLTALLNNTTGGAIYVNLTAVQAELGDIAAQSVRNKLVDLKKNYNIVFSTSKAPDATKTPAATPKKRKAESEDSSPTPTKKAGRKTASKKNESGSDFTIHEDEDTVME